MEIIVSKRLVFINAVSSVLTRLLSVFVLAWLYQYLLERIPVDEFSIYPIIMSVMVVAPIFSSLFASGTSRYIVEASAQGNVERVTTIFSSVLPYLCLITGTFLFAGLLLAVYIDDVLTISPAYSSEASWMLALLVIGFAVRLITTPYVAAFHAHQRFVLLNLIDVGREVLRIALLLILLIGVSTKVFWVVVASMAAEVTAALISTYIGWRMLPALRFDRSHCQPEVGRELMSFGGWSSIGQIANMIYISAGTIVLNKLGSAADVTSYHLGLTAHRQIHGAATMAAVPLQPVLTTFHARQEIDRLGNAYLRGGRYALWATMFLATPLIILSPEIISLYVGDRFIDAAGVIILLLGTYPILQANAMLPKVATAVGRIRGFVVGSLITNVISLLSMIYIIGFMELQSKALATAAMVCAATIISHTVFFIPLALRLARINVARFLTDTLVPGLSPAAAAAIAILAVQYVFGSPGNWTAVALVSGIGAIFYLVTILSVCLTSDEKSMLHSTLTNLRNIVGKRAPVE